METGFDWLAYAYGVASGVALALLMRFRSNRNARPNLDRAPAMPVSIPPALLPEVRRLRAEGHVIHAIKLVREETGCDLKQAKDAVDQLR
jgi:hypothetical protein